MYVYVSGLMAVDLTIHLSYFNSRESELQLTRDDIPDVLVGMLSQSGFKVMQKCNFNFISIYQYYWWEHSIMHYVYYIERYLGLIVYLTSYGIINSEQMKCLDTSLFMLDSFYYMKSLSTPGDNCYDRKAIVD